MRCQNQFHPWEMDTKEVFLLVENVISLYLVVMVETEELNNTHLNMKMFMLFGILTKWSDSSRLETRTKESNMCASIWVSNPNAQ